MFKKNYETFTQMLMNFSHTVTSVLPSALVFQMNYSLILNTLFAHATSQLRRSTRTVRLEAVAPPLTSPHTCSPSPPQK